MALPLPTPYFENPVKQEICRRLSNGETMRQLEDQPGLPTRETVRLWRHADRDFDLAITHAYVQCGSALADEAIALARLTANSDKDKAMSNRVTIDTLKWAASKFYPKMFGSQDGPRTHTQVNVGEIKVLVSPEQRQAMIKARAELLGDTSEAEASDDGMPEPEQEQEPVDKDSG